MNDDKITKEVKAHETRGAREISPPKEQTKPPTTEGKSK